MTACPVCDAAEHASDDTLASLVRRQAVTITRLRDRLDSFGLARAEARVRELEEILERTNRTAPQKVAVEIARELARTDPRDCETLRCQWCGETNQHRKDCTWRQAQIVAEQAQKRETQAVVERWRAV